MSPALHDDTDDTPARLDASAKEREQQDADARALAESGLGSGLLARQDALDAEVVPVLKVCPHCSAEYETTARFCPSDGTALRPKGSDTLVGRVLADRYHILKRIGEGGMGRVYLGEHVKMQRQCAIKVMNPSLVNDAESSSRFAREASNAARIIHPNVAAVFDYGESDGLVYLVMEFVDGEPLSRLLLREAPLALERALEITRQIADGLGAAHELGIIHRDLKPDNILVTRNRAEREIAKVVDFGIAKAIQEGAGDPLTRTGQVIGTPEFMSPEQLVGDPIDARSDLYALGCILHLMLVAAPPFAAETREQMIKHRLAQDAPSIQLVDPGIPESVTGIVARLRARTPKDRYGSAAEVRDALAGTHVRRGPVGLQASLGFHPTPRSAPTVAFLQATQATTEITPVPFAKPVRRAPLVVSLVIAAALGAALLMRGDSNVVDAERRSSIGADSIGRSLARATRSDAMATRPAATPGVPASDNPSAATTRHTPVTRPEEKPVRAGVDSAPIAGAHAAISRYARAIASGNIATLRLAHQTMTPQQNEYWERNVFARAEHIDATIRYGRTRVSGDTANVDFSLLLRFVLKDTKQSSSAIRPQHATVVRHGKTWQIATLR